MSDAFAEKRSILEQERALLLRRIDELTIGGEIDMDYDDDFADRAQVAGEVGENLTLANALDVQLRLVEKALVRMDEGTFGTCEVCTEPIETERLNILPMTNHCIAHA